jgi:hypothetical protein
VKREAEALGTRLAGWQFLVPEYKFNQIFEPVDTLTRKPEPPAKKAKAEPPPNK